MKRPGKSLEDRAALSIQAQQMRDLWAAVALHAINEAATTVASSMKLGQSAAAQMAIDRFRRWVYSKDGTEVLSLCGVEVSDRARDALVGIVSRGNNSSDYSPRKRAYTFLGQR